MHFTLPIKDPFLIFALALLLVFFAPIIARRIRLPGLVLTIAAGMAIGPYGFGVLDRDPSIVLFGSVGLLYLMFLAGLEIDLFEVQKRSGGMISFGLLTFILPVAGGLIVAIPLLDLPVRGALLVGAAMATHTLLSLPIAQRLGIGQHSIVKLAIGGSFITDSLALVMLGAVVESLHGGLGLWFWIRLAGSMIFLIGVVLVAFPAVARWFFARVDSEGVSQFTFVLVLVFFAAVLADVLDVEPILGAFLGGIALKRVIPPSSALMNRLEFVGHSLFIPFFFLSVGMLIDVGGAISNLDVIKIAAIFCAVALLSKLIPAVIYGLVAGVRPRDMAILFGLTVSRAAATLVVALIAFEADLLSREIFDAIVIMILVTALVSSVTVQKAGHKIAAEHVPEMIASGTPTAVVVPLQNPARVQSLIELAGMFHPPKGNFILHPLIVRLEDEDHSDGPNPLVTSALHYATTAGIQAKPLVRVDINVAGGIVRAAKEASAGTIVLGWNAAYTLKERIFGRVTIFGSVLDQVLEASGLRVFVCKIASPLNSMKKSRIVLPPLSFLEPDFVDTLAVLAKLIENCGHSAIISGDADSVRAVQGIWQGISPNTPAKFDEENDHAKLISLPGELLIALSARRDTPSYTRLLDKLPRIISRSHTDASFVIAYPKQAMSI